jgi:hypothetical protein
MKKGFTVKHTEFKIVTFEEKHKIILPNPYKYYLLNNELNDCNLSHLDDWCQPQSEEEMPINFLSMPFMHNKAWNNLSLTSIGPIKRHNSEYRNEIYFCGSLRFYNIGCELYLLLVVSGEERGSVWADLRADAEGIKPMYQNNGDVSGFELFLESYRKGLYLKHLSELRESPRLDLRK